MTQLRLSQKKIKSLCFILVLVGLASVSFFNIWWPSIMLVVGIPLAIRQYLMGRYYDMVISLIVFVCVFVTVQFHIPWRLLLPILFGIGAIYVFFRDNLESKEKSEVEIEEDLNEEIEEDEAEEHKD